MQQALDGLDGLRERARAASASAGNREYNPGWHTALDLRNLLTVSEAITRCGARAQESRGGHFRDDYPGQGPERSASSTSSSRKGRDGAMQVDARADSRRCRPS